MDAQRYRTALATAPARRAAGAQARPSLLAGVRELFLAAYLSCGYVQLRDALLSWLGRSRMVVVYYHRIGDRDVLSKPLEEFRRDLAYFRQHYECISLQELSIRLRSGMPIRRRALVVTFDDGYRDNFTQAVPALLEAGIPATFFVSTAFIGTDRVFAHDRRASRQAGEREDEQALAARYPKLTWEDLAAMEAGGMEIGSHTMHHVDLGAADEQTVQREVLQSMAELDRQLGAKPRPFSFPWGKPQNLSEPALGAARAAGYYAAVSAYGGSNTRGTSPWRIRRVDVGNGHLSFAAVQARVAGLDRDYLKLRLRRKLPRGSSGA